MSAVPRPDVHDYWEERARAFARDGEALRAVCSYGMPDFYNREIQLTQRLALNRHLQFGPLTLLDLGCGVGRWSRLAAANGANVVGVDISPTMIGEARRRALVERVAERCQFVVGDASTVDLRRTFDRVLAVTVLQHILAPDRFRAAVSTIERHLAPGGRAIVLEAAPSRSNDRCDTRVFRARVADEYLRAFSAVGLCHVETAGVDPAPFKTLILPRYQSLPRGIREAALLAVTAASLPVDVLLGRRLPRWSWHKLFLFEKR